MRRLSALVVALGLLAAGCGDTATPTTPATTAPPPIPSTTAAPQYLEDFEFVWTTIDDRYFDPDFGGVDWDAVHHRYLPKVVDVADDPGFLELINAMLFELGASHLFVLPPDAGFVDPALTIEGELGLQVRVLDEQWVITEVEEGSPAAAAGLLPGYLLDHIGGRSVEDVATEWPALPPLHERGVRSSRILAVEEALLGDPGATTTIGYRDEAGVADEVALTFRHRGASTELIPGYPPVFTTLEFERLEAGIGYIRFDPFAPGLAAPILDAIDAMPDAPGLVFDVRGNHGGDSEVAAQLISRLVDEPLPIWSLTFRNRTETVYADPVAAPYGGPVAVLVDVVSGSAAEAFSSGVQAIGRAVVVGERTAGRLLGGDIAQLPMGVLMVYPIVAFATADGTVVEGRGVVPDVPVAVHRTDLLAGRDPALEAAIDHLLAASG